MERINNDGKTTEYRLVSADRKIVFYTNWELEGQQELIDKLKVVNGIDTLSDDIPLTIDTYSFTIGVDDLFSLVEVAKNVLYIIDQYQQAK